jgi:hypothetical protein
MLCMTLFHVLILTVGHDSLIMCVCLCVYSGVCVCVYNYVYLKMHNIIIMMFWDNLYTQSMQLACCSLVSAHSSMALLIIANRAKRNKIFLSCQRISISYSDSY